MDVIEFPNHWDKTQTESVSKETFDKQVDVYEAMVKQASEFGFINSGGGGVLVLVHPQTQLDERTVS